MILLDKVKLLYKALKPGFILMIPVFLGCETASDIGIQYELQADANVQFVDFTLPATNIKIDSLRTDNGVSGNRILVGNYSDDLVGSVTAEGYFSVTYRGSNIPNGVVDSTFTYDSIRFAFAASDFVSQTSALTQAFSIYLLPDTINSLVCLSNKNEPLGDLISDYEVTYTDSSRIGNIEFPRAFGQDFFDLVQEDTATSTFVITEWPSMALVPNAMTNSISEIDLSDDTTAFYIYVTDPMYEKVVDGDTTIIDSTFVAAFSLVAPVGGGSLPHYTHLERDNSAAQLNMSEDREKQDLSTGQTVIDPLAGVSTSFSIPELEAFFEENDPASNPIIINSATISFEIEESASRDTLANFFAFLETDGDFFGAGLEVNSFKNLVMSDNAFLGTSRLGAISSLNSDGDEIVFSPTLFIQTLYRNYHDFELLDELGIDEPTLYVEDFLSVGFRKIDGFVLIGVDDVTAERVVFKQDGIKMRIYYTEVN